MDAQVKEIWATALESGEYQQVQEMMWDGGGGFCCLGVLADLCGKAVGVPVHARSEVLTQRDAEYPSEFVTRWAGFPEGVGDPKLTIDGTYLDASEHNDNHVPFKKIAKAIREQL